MLKKILFATVGILLISCLISGVMAEKVTKKTGDQSESLSYACTQPYAICDTAFCIPDQDDPSKMRCSCTVENGTSLGKMPCGEWDAVGMFYDDTQKQWMIKGGYAVGQVTSTYSFIDAAPIKGNEIDPNTTPADYTGDVYLKTCANEKGDGKYADCWNAPCTVLPQDINVDINTDRVASPYAVCDCGLVANLSKWSIAVHGTDNCNNKTLCNDYIISGEPINTSKFGVLKLNEYLKDNPGVDPAQPYKEGFCEDCTECASNTSAGSS